MKPRINGTPNRPPPLPPAYVPHPEGTARVRWLKSRSLLSFPEWCLEQGLAER